jgi:hypothetical protein
MGLNSKESKGRAPRAPRYRDADQRLLDVLGRLTDRDRHLCRLLYEHRVLVSSQVADIGFTGARRTRLRLGELYDLAVVDRFRPRAQVGSAPYHWVLGPVGAALVAAERGIETADLEWRKGLLSDLAASQRLAHLVGTNGVFTALMRSARRRPGCRLEVWWSEQRCAKEWGEIVRPDGYGIWVDNDVRLPFLLEYDNGTETLERLSAKLPGYAELAAAAGHPNWVLFTFPSPRREREARRVLSHRQVPVATAALVPGDPPNAAHWLPVGSSGTRLGLAQLVGRPGPT